MAIPSLTASQFAALRSQKDVSGQYPTFHLQDRFLSSADAYDPAEVIKVFSIGYASVPLDQLHVVAEEVNVPLVQRLTTTFENATHVGSFPCIVVPLILSQLPSGMRPDRTTSVSRNCSFVVLDGTQRIVAMREIYAASNFVQVLVLHPDVLHLPDAAYRLLRESLPADGMTIRPRHPVALLSLVISAAHDLYALRHAEKIPRVIAAVLGGKIPTRGDQTSKNAASTPMQPIFARIASSQHIVTALVETRLLDTPLWRDAAEDTISFLSSLEWFRVSKTAVTVINCARAILNDLAAELSRPFVLEDLLPEGLPLSVLEDCGWDSLSPLALSEGTFSGIPFNEFSSIITSNTKAFGLPTVWICPWAIHPKPQTGRILNVFLWRMREVLKVSVILSQGFDPMRYLSRHGTLVIYPSSPKTDVWSVIHEYFCERQIFDKVTAEEKVDSIVHYLIPRRVAYLYDKWVRFVMAPAGGHLPRGGGIDPRMQVTNNAQARKAVSSRIPTLLYACEDWYNLGLYLDLGPGEVLLCSERGCEPVLFTRDNPGPDTPPDSPSSPPFLDATLPTADIGSTLDHDMFGPLSHPLFPSSPTTLPSNDDLLSMFLSGEMPDVMSCETTTDVGGIGPPLDASSVPPFCFFNPSDFGAATALPSTGPATSTPFASVDELFRDMENGFPQAGIVPNFGGRHDAATFQPELYPQEMLAPASGGVLLLPDSRPSDASGPVTFAWDGANAPGTSSLMFFTEDPNTNFSEFLPWGSFPGEVDYMINDLSTSDTYDISNFS